MKRCMFYWVCVEDWRFCSLGYADTQPAMKASLSKLFSSDKLIEVIVHLKNNEKINAFIFKLLMKLACKINKKRMRWARHWCLWSVQPKPAVEPRAKNLQSGARNAVGFTVARAPDRGPSKAERGSRRRILNMAKDQNGLFKCGQRFGKNFVKSKREWRLMALSKNLVERVGTHDFLAMT